MDDRTLDVGESEGLASHRDWLNELLAGVGSNDRLTGRVQDLPTLQSLLDAGPYTDDALAEVNALGTALGDIFAAELGLTWVVVSDDTGVDFALRHPLNAVYVFPHDMLLKRIEAGAATDLATLFREVRQAVLSQLSSAALHTP